MQNITLLFYKNENECGRFESSRQFLEQTRQQRVKKVKKRFTRKRFFAQITEDLVVLFSPEMESGLVSLQATRSLNWGSFFFVLELLKIKNSLSLKNKILLQ